MHALFRITAALPVMGVSLALAARQAQAQAVAGMPAPDVRDEKYGPERSQRLDLWKAKSGLPTPLVVYIHGGAFKTGGKEYARTIEFTSQYVKRCLASGLSVASINYRLSGEAPFPAPMRDSGRAVQYLRSKAKEWNLHPALVGAIGESAGAGISLWLALHDDLADPQSPDLVLRESSRLSCAAGERAQTSYDPRFMKEFIGPDTHKHPFGPPFWGLQPEEMETGKARKIFDECSPITHLTKDDPPVLLLYSGPVRKDDHDIHSPKFGAVLKERMDKLSLSCTLVTEPYKPEAIVEFFVQHLQGAKPALKAP